MGMKNEIETGYRYDRKSDKWRNVTVKKKQELGEPSNALNENSNSTIECTHMVVVSTAPFDSMFPAGPCLRCGELIPYCVRHGKALISAGMTELGECWNCDECDPPISSYFSSDPR